MNKIKIAHVTFSLDTGGAEMVILDLCKHIDRTRFDPVVCSLSPGGSLRREFERARIPVFTVEKKEGKDWKLLFKLFRFFRKEKIDILHAHLSYMWLYSILPAKCAGVKGFIVTEHSSKINPSRLFCFLSRLFQRFTDFITVNSRQIAEALVHDEGLEDYNIRVLPNGLSTEPFQKRFDKGAIRAALDIGMNQFVAGTVCRLFPPKDPVTLVKAVHALTEIDDLILLIVGTGDLEPALRELVLRNSLQKKIRFLGFRRDIPELLAAMDVFVLSSIKEGQSISIMEAMASGLPVIATGTGGTPELVLDGVTGLLTPAQDSAALALAIRTVHAHRNRAACMGNSGRKRIEETYALSTILKRVEDLYQTAAGR